MANDTRIKRKHLSEINKTTFKEAIYLSYENGITSSAPLGWSGDTIILFNAVHHDDSKKTWRCSQVSIRNYCGDAELLITDYDGNFLFYGRFDVNLGVDLLATEYWRIFKMLRAKIETSIPKISDFKHIRTKPNIKPSEGFRLLKAFQNSHTTA